MDNSTSSDRFVKYFREGFFLVGTNSSFIGKADEATKKKLAIVGFWKPTYFETIAELLAHISKGHAWIPCPVDEGKWKKQENCNYLQILGGDVDHDLPIEEAMKNPLIRDYANAIIQSASSTPEENRYRIIFRLRKPIIGYKNIQKFLRFFTDVLLPFTDKACKNTDRIFYGSPGREPEFCYEDRYLPDWVFEQFEAYQAEQERIEKERMEQAERYNAQLKNADVSEGDIQALAAKALSYCGRKSPGSGNRAEMISILAGLVHTFGVSTAVSMMEAHSHSYPKSGNHSEWNVEKTARSLDKPHGGNEASLGSLFYYAKKGNFVFEKRKWNGDNWKPAKKGEYTKTLIQDIKDRVVLPTQAFIDESVIPPSFTSEELEGTPPSSPPSELSVTPTKTKQTSPAAIAAKKVVKLEPKAPVNPLEAQAEESQWKQWKRFTMGYTPNVEIDTKFITLDLIKDRITENTGIISVHSGLGTGKTFLLQPPPEANQEGLIDYLHKLHAHKFPDGMGVAMLGYRNTLLLQTGEKIGTTQVSELAEWQKNIPTARVSACVDSLLSFPIGFAKNKILIFDEWISILAHTIVGSTCYQNRQEILTRFVEFVKDAAVIVCLDGNMTDEAVNYLKELRYGDRPIAADEIVKIWNKTQSKDDINVEVIASFSTEPLLKKMRDLIPYYDAKGHSVGLATDSQAFGEKVNEILVAAGYNCLRIDSKTIYKQEVQDFIKSPDSREIQPTVLGYSPSGESGMSVDSKKYKHVFAHFCGVVSTATQIQMLRRCRAATSITVQCVPYNRINKSQATRLQEFDDDQKFAVTDIWNASSNGVTTEEYARKLLGALNLTPEKQQEFIEQVKSFIKQTPEGQKVIHNTMYNKLKIFRNFEERNTLRCFIDILQHHGYKPNILDDGETTGQLKEALNEQRKEEAVNILNSEPITDEVAEALTLKAQKNPWTAEERSAYRAWEIRKAYPDEWRDNWNADWIYEKDTELIEGLDHKEKLKEVTRAIQLNEATQILKARDITGGQAEALRKRMALNPTEYFELERYKIKVINLPGFDTKHPEFWTEEWIVELRKRLHNLSKYRLQWYYENLEKGAVIRRQKWLRDIESNRFLGDCLQNNYVGQAALLHEMLSVLPENFSADTKEVKDLYDAHRSKYRRIRAVLHYVKGQRKPVEVVKNWLGKMGRKIMLVGKEIGKPRTYKIAPLDDLDRAIFTCSSEVQESLYRSALEEDQKNSKDVLNPKVAIVQNPQESVSGDRGKAVMVQTTQNTFQNVTKEYQNSARLVTENEMPPPINVAKLQKFDCVRYYDTRGGYLVDAIYIRTFANEVTLYFPDFNRTYDILSGKHHLIKEPLQGSSKAHPALIEYLEYRAIA